MAVGFDDYLQVTGIHGKDAGFSKLILAKNKHSLARDLLMDMGKLNWKRVVTSDGTTIGELQGGEIDTKSLKLTHIHVGLNDATMKELGLKRTYLGQILICLSVDMIQGVNDTVTLNKSFEELKSKKECKEFSAN